MSILDAKIHVEASPSGFRSGECRVARLFQVQLASVERLAEQRQVYASAQPPAPKGLVVSVLQIKLLVLEQADLIVREAHPDTVSGTDEEQRHVHISVHDSRGTFETGHLHAIRSLEVQHRLLPRGRGVIKRRHGPIVDKRRVVLGLCSAGQKAQQHDHPYQDPCSLHPGFQYCAQTKKQHSGLFIACEGLNFRLSTQNNGAGCACAPAPKYPRLSLSILPAGINPRPR